MFVAAALAVMQALPNVCLCDEQQITSRALISINDRLLCGFRDNTA